jgi:hypothetical protein
MGLTRLELVTPALSERCSNQLSYKPVIKKKRRTDIDPVYQPGLRQRLVTENSVKLCKETNPCAFLVERR